MPVNLSPSDLAGIAATLRAAGCVFAEEEADLLTGAAGTMAELEAMVALRASGLPIEQIVGWADFCGLRLIIEPDVFVPRRRSEFLVQQAAALAPAGRHPVILDMCCGSGAVGLALATALGPAELHAADVEPRAVHCAGVNLAGRGEVYEGDLYEPLPERLLGRVDILVANAPYVPTAEIAFMPAEARLHEPAVALDGGPDGVALHRRIAAGAPGWLAPGGWLLIETSSRQAPLTAAAIRAAGLKTQVVSDDDLGATVAIGQRPAG